MEDGVSSRFSSEASDYLLPPSHKVIVLMDHGPRLAVDANCPVSIAVKHNPADKKTTIMQRNVWTMAVEATLEAHRVVSDLFPDGSRLMRFVLADAVSRKLNATWGKALLRQPELLSQLSSTGAPTTAAGAGGDAEASFLPQGVQLAVETLSETTERYTKMKGMDPREQVALIKYLSHSFAWKIHPTKTTQEKMKQEKGLRLGKTTITKTVTNPNGEEEEDSKVVQRPCYLMNKGSILVMTRMKSDAEVAALEKEVTEAIGKRNTHLSKNKDRGTARVDHVSLFILNMLPVGEDATITSKPLTKINETVSCGVRSCCVKGDQLITGVHGVLMPLYDLVSTTVTGIPMKEESNSSHSVNYDVELLHQRLAHSELARNGLLKDDMPKAATYPEVMGTNEDGMGKKEEQKKEGEPVCPGLIATLHDGAYSTVRLTWATPSPKTAWNMFPRSRSSYPVTPSYLNARPSICLTSFLGQGKSVMLEVKNPPLAPLLTVEQQAAAVAERRERKKKVMAEMPPERRKAAENIVSRRLTERRKMRKAGKSVIKGAGDAKLPTAKAPKKEKKLLTKRRGTGLQPNLHGTRLISHTLIAHSGRIYIHEIALDGGTIKCEMPRQAAGFKPVPDLRVTDFRGLIREMMITLPLKAKLIEYADKKAKGLLPKNGGPPNKDARTRALRLTRYWPLKMSHSFIYNVRQKLDPLFSVMRKAELSTADVDKCKQTIKKIMEARDSPDLFTYTKFQCDVMTDQLSRDEQLSTLLREITAHLTNYAAHSERHTEVFTLWAQASHEENANALDPVQLADVNVTTRFDQLFVQQLAEEDKWRVRRLRRAGRVGGGAATAADLVAAAACSRHARGGAAAGQLQPAEDDDCARIRAPARALAVAMAVLQGRDREGAEPAAKRARVHPKFQWTHGETRDILHLLRANQDPTMLVPRRDFVGREQAPGPQAKLYPQLGDIADRGPKPIVG